MQQIEAGRHIWSVIKVSADGKFLALGSSSAFDGLNATDTNAFIQTATIDETVAEPASIHVAAEGNRL